jgi:hypothetical protein
MYGRLIRSNDFFVFPRQENRCSSWELLNTTSKFSRSGFFLKDGFKMIFQTATPIFLSRDDFKL